MAASRGPRIGRPDRLAALREGGARIFRRDIFRAAHRNDLEMLLAGPTVAPEQPAPAPTPAPQASLCERAEQLAQQLEPLPGALDEIATRISRHCARTDRDAELARVVEAVRERTFALWRAVDQLAVAARGGQGAGLVKEGA
jgi:hypothetical protein